MVRYCDHVLEIGNIICDMVRYGYNILVKRKKCTMMCDMVTSFFIFTQQGGISPVPYKPKRPCSFPGCPRLTNGRFCDEHAKAEARRYEKYDRPPEVKKRYGRAWQVIRDRYIAAHPLCEMCKKKGKLTPAEEVHHIKPLSQGGTNAEDNLMSICKVCHSEITAREGGRWKPRHKK